MLLSSLFFRNAQDDNTTGALGWILGILMAFAYLTGRLPQCMLNCSHDFEIGVSVSTMVFTFLGNGTYLGSILARGLGWNRLKLILPWVFDVSVCLFMDISVSAHHTDYSTLPFNVFDSCASWSFDAVVSFYKSDCWQHNHFPCVSNYV